VPSPLRFTPHAKPHAKIITWFGVYQSSIPNMEMGVEPTVGLDDDNEPQPDVILCNFIESRRTGFSPMENPNGTTNDNSGNISFL
jgi:hypothetical protein